MAFKILAASGHRLAGTGRSAHRVVPFARVAAKRQIPVNHVESTAYADPPATGRRKMVHEFGGFSICPYFQRCDFASLKRRAEIGERVGFERIDESA